MGRQGFIQQPLSWNIIHFDLLFWFCGQVQGSPKLTPILQGFPCSDGLGAREYLRTQAIR